MTKYTNFILITRSLFINNHNCAYFIFGYRGIYIMIKIKFIKLHCTKETLLTVVYL